MKGIKILFNDGRVQEGIKSLTPKCSGGFFYPEFNDGVEPIKDILDDDGDIDNSDIELISYSEE